MGAPFMPRERLIEQIRAADWAKLVLVQAPAGFGTTTLLRHAHDLFRAAGCTTAWLTLDAEDNDQERLMACLAAAIAQAGATAGSDEGIDPIQALTAAPLPFMLVLDEFEHLHNAAALALIQKIVDMLGPRQRILIGSREQPGLGLGRLRARQQLLEIDAAQLRFSFEESSRFLCEKRGLELDRQDIEHLHQVTGGWAAALWLSSLALENSDDPKRFIRTFSGSSTVVASYLAEAVLSHRPRHLQEFILQTSVLRKFCADSCNAVTGRSDSRKVLEEIERSNMFMTAEDDQRIWFSYHPLFAGFLRAQLERQLPGLSATLHRRAALWYESQGRPTPAIDHAIASEDRELTMALLARHAETVFLQGRVRLLARWFDVLDCSALAEHPKLVSVFACSLIHLNRCAEALALLESPAGGKRALSMSHTNYLVLKTFSLVMLDCIEQTAPMWEDPRILGCAENQPLLRSMLMIGCAYYFATTARYREARLLLDQATHEHPSVGPLFSVTVAGYIHAMLDLMQGHLRAAGARLRALIGAAPGSAIRYSGIRLGALLGIDAAGATARRGADSGFAGVYLAEVLYETDVTDEARRLLDSYLPVVKEAGIPDQLISSHLIQARLLRNDGSGDEALQILLELEQIGLQRRLPRVVDSARLERARCALLDGDAEAARALLALVGTTPSWQRHDLRMVAGDLDTPLLGNLRWQVHQGQAAAALPLLKEHLQDAYARGRIRYALRVKVLYSLALMNAGQRNPSLRTLREVLQEAEAEGFVRVFKDEGPAALSLVADMLDTMQDNGSRDRHAVRSFAERLIGRLDAPATQSATAKAIPLSTNSDGDLTAREFEVLELLSRGCGNQEMAEKLFVSVATIKTHLRNINAKLGARNRTEAISIARRNSIIA